MFSVLVSILRFLMENACKVACLGHADDSVEGLNKSKKHTVIGFNGNAGPAIKWV
jgi:hypothetical protein